MKESFWEFTGSSEEEEEEKRRSVIYH